MGYNIHDLKNGVEQFHDNIKQRQQAKGEKLANDITYGTSQGRGLWLPLIWTGCLLLFGWVASTIIVMVFGAETMFSFGGLVGVVVGFVVAKAWYNWGYTRRHPLLSSMLACFGPGLFIMIFL